MLQPFVSVIVPAHNRKKELDVVLRSLISQSYPREKYEILVIDDSVPPLKPAFRSVRYFHIPPSSHSRARNLGIRQAKGEIIAFTDDDCVPRRDWIEKICLPFQKPETSGVEGKTVSEKMEAGYHATENLGGNKYPTCNIAFRKNVLEEVGGFDEKYGFFREDTDLAFAVLSKNKKIVFAGDAVVFHPPRKIPPHTPLKELGMIKSDIRLYKKFPSLYRKYIGPPGGGGVKISFLSWAFTLSFLYLLLAGSPAAAIPLILVILLKYETHLKGRVFSPGGYAGYIAFSWLRDLLYPFFFSFYYLTENPGNQRPL
jgi:glycosyltransferase involved in cell wall biosynthesis